MPASTSLFQGFGDLHLPVDASGVTDGLTSLDPPRAILAGLFRAAINAEYGEAWSKVVGTASGPAGVLGSSHPLYDTDPVADVLELEPSGPVMQQRKPKFPLLCVYRDGEGQLDQITLFDDRLTQQWTVDYILGPLDIADLRKLGDMCVAVAKLIKLVIRQRGHRAYQNGAIQFFPGVGGLASVDLKSVDGPGQASFAGDENGTLYYAVTLKLETVERTTDDLTAIGELEGVAGSFGVGNGDEILPDLIQGDSSVPIQEG